MSKSNFLKSLLAITMSAAMVFSMVGCNNSADVGKSDSSANINSSKGGKDTAGIDTSKAVNLTFVALGDKPTNGRLDNMLVKLNAILKEKINAEISFRFVEWADWQTQYNLLLASGDSSIDMITTASDWLDAWPNVKKGAFLPLTEDMLKTYAPKTWESVKPEYWDTCKYQDKIYLMPEENFTQYINHGMFYRGDWAKEFGIDKVNSFQDIGKYLQGVKDKKKDVIPWDIEGNAGQANELARGYMNSTTSNILIDGIPVGLSTLFYTKSKDDLYTLTSPFVEGTSLEDFAVMMKSWSDAGYWREDVLNYTGSTADMLYAGQSGMANQQTQQFTTDIRPKMDQKQPGSDLKMFAYGQPTKNLVKTVSTHGALAINAASKNPERALMAYDLIRNDKDCYRLMNYGIEGTDYVLTDKGQLARPEGFDGTKDSLGSNFWSGRSDHMELVDSTWYAGRADMFKEYNTYAIDYPYGQLIIDISGITNEITAMADVCNKYIPVIAFGKTKDPKAEVAKFKTELKDAGYQKAFDEIQSQLTAFGKSKK